MNKQLIFAGFTALVAALIAAACGALTPDALATSGAIGSNGVSAAGACVDAELPTCIRATFLDE